MITDCIIADPKDAKAICDAAATHRQHWPCLSTVEDGLLRSLWDILVPGVDSERIVLAGSPICEAESGEAWVFVLPDDFVEALSECDAARIRGVAPAWAATAKFAVFPVDAAAQVIEELVGFAKRARNEGKSLLLYVAT